MLIEVIRDIVTERSTASRIRIDNVDFCYGLEPPPGADPATNMLIAALEYDVILRWSPANHCWVIEVCGVPGHSNVEVHIGNYPKDTRACLLVGLSRVPDGVTHSADAFELLWRKIVERLPHQPIRMRYVNAFAGGDHVNAANA